MSSSSRPVVPQRTAVLLNRVDQASEQLLTKFSEIVTLSSNSGKDRGTIASESMQIETNASTIVRAAEDLLFVTRSLKEAWILGQIKPTQDDEAERDGDDKHDQGNKLLDAILSENK
ncbi:mediator of RNA polymerase II transcription subunit 22 [Trichomonascus vanleenenianus]|uniref:Srb6p n=1 Tax=Trichomonascus vanleenenianus TaxID=2268995 RepID=UPI003ECA20C5